MKILSIEDSKEMQILISLALKEKFEVDFADDYSNGIAKIFQNHYDCLLIDINLPDSSGFNILKQLLSSDKKHQTPVIFVSSEDCENVIARAFYEGADDYIVKPIKPIELAARITSKINKNAKMISPEFSVGPFKFNVLTSKIHALKNAEWCEVPLTPIEFKILLQVCKSPGKIFSREMLINNLWGSEYFLESRSIDKHISSLRQKIKPFEHLIKTKSGKGYLFEPEPIPAMA